MSNFAASKDDARRQRRCGDKDAIARGMENYQQDVEDAAKVAEDKRRLTICQGYNPETGLEYLSVLDWMNTVETLGDLSEEEQHAVDDTGIRWWDESDDSDLLDDRDVELADAAYRADEPYYAASYPHLI